MTSLDARVSGSSDRSTPKSASSSSSQSSVSSRSSIVRDALVKSVACTRPSVSFQTSHESTVPNASPSGLRSRRSHSSFVAEKYGSGTRPVRARIRSAGSSRQRSAVRRSCHTIARCTGSPDRRSHSSVVSRWFDPDRLNVAGPDACIGERLLRSSDDALPDVLGFVLDPPRQRVVLPHGAVPAPARTQLGVDHEARRARGALVNREDHRGRAYL